MQYYSEPEALTQKAVETFDRGRAQQSLILYTEAISMFINKYKEDRNYERKAHYTIVIGRHLTAAERIKKIVRLPVPPAKKPLSPVVEVEEELMRVEEELMSIKIGEGD